ncbi:MAG: hypothetical protein JWO02_542, partial [Solirubrobacterales bacterium]|nr:hypothetical protein [Solirubrobacterales bacterium]
DHAPAGGSGLCPSSRRCPACARAKGGAIAAFRARAIAQRSRSCAGRETAGASEAGRVAEAPRAPLRREGRSACSSRSHLAGRRMEAGGATRVAGRELGRAGWPGASRFLAALRHPARLVAVAVPGRATGRPPPGPPMTHAKGRDRRLDGTVEARPVSDDHPLGAAAGCPERRTKGRADPPCQAPRYRSLIISPRPGIRSGPSAVARRCDAAAPVRTRRPTGRWGNRRSMFRRPAGRRAPS